MLSDWCVVMKILIVFLVDLNMYFQNFVVRELSQ